MSSKRNHTPNNNSSGGGYNNRNHHRGQSRDKSQRPPHKSYEPTLSNETRAVQLLRRIFNDDDDSLFSRRIGNANQLLKMLEESRSTISDSLEFRQEQKQLLDICVYDEGLRRIVEFTKAPPALRNTMMKIVSGLACYTRLDLALSWIFDRLSVWETSVNDASKDREWKKWLLRLLKQILMDSAADQYTYKQTLEMSPMILASIISFLDTMDSSDYLSTVVEILVYFSEHYQNIFGQRFNDIIDLLVGWNMDPELTESKRATIVSSYSKFSVFWAGYLPFAIELLNHFLTDMQTLIRELTSSTLTPEAQTKKWAACTSLLSCFHAILDTILPLMTTHSSSTYHNYQAFNKLLPGLLDLAVKAQQAKPDDQWKQSVNTLLLLLISYEPAKYRAYQFQLYLHLFGYQHKQAILAGSSEDCQHYFDKLLQFINHWGQDIDEQIVYQLLDVQLSPLYKMRSQYPHHDRLKSGLLLLLRFLIRVPVSDHTRNQLNHQLIAKLEELQLPLKQQQITSSKSQSTLQRTLALIDQNDGSIALSLPADTATKRLDEKHIQDTLFYHYLLLDTAAVWPMLRFENSLISLEMLCITWQNKMNDVFDSCFQLLKNFWASLHYMLEDEYAVEMITCLVTDLSDHWKELNLQTRQSVCHFVKAVLVELYDTENLHLDVHTLFKPVVSGFLHAAGKERNSNTKQLILELVTYYCQVFGSAALIDLILEHVQRSINNPHSKVQRASKDLLTSLNPFMISEVNKFDDYTTAFIQSIMMATPHTGSFRPVHYEIVMKHLGMSKHLLGGNEAQDDDSSQLESEDNPSAWARRLLHHCDTINNMKHVSIFAELKEDMELGSIVDLINNSEPLLCYWAMWESARYCMLSRLRTPFGGPQQTFAAFERMLQTLLSNAESKECDGDKNMDYLRHLLLLLDRLELQISNATDGCATASLPAVPRSSIVFFRTNKKTCHDYFLRIRPSMIAGAKIVRNDHLLITHATQILKELETAVPPTDVSSWFKQINGYLRDLVEACIREKYMDLIYGLQAWYKKLIRRVQHVHPKSQLSFAGLIGPVKEASEESTSSNVTWFQVAAQFASGRDEAAIKALTNLKLLVHQDEFGILDMLDRQVIYFYTCLEDYDSLQKALDSGSTVIDGFICESLRAFNAGNQASVKEQEETVKNLNAFVTNAPLESCLELSRLDAFRHWLVSSSSINTGTRDDSLHTGITTRLTGRILQVLKDGIFSNISSLLELQLLQSDWENLIASAKDWLYMTSGNVSNFHHLPPETKHWARLSTYFERLYTHNNASEHAEVTQCLGFIQLHAAKVARRQGNILLAEHMVNKAVHIPDTEYLALYERTKILFTQCEYAHAMKTANSVLMHVTSAPGYEELKSKTYLRVARYLKNCPDTEVEGLLHQLDASLVKMQATDLQSAVEVSIDDALEKSIENNTTDGRPWFEYATHYYKQGWRILDDVTKADASMPAVVWAKNKIQGLLGDAVDSKQVEKSIFASLLKYSTAVGDKELSDFDALNTELKQLTPSLEPNSQAIIVGTLNVLQQMIVGKFYASAQAYFRYLSLDIHNQQHSDSSANISSTSMIITATLRLLRILTKYGKALQSLFTKHIDMVRVDLWKPVIPQLFAQLNHPNDFVRHIIGKLISRICDEYPREIVYDVIVNSTSSKTNRETKQSLDTIANRMMDRNELLWVSTRRMAEELEKITVLLEERWLNKIASLQFDVMQQFTKLDQESERLQKSNMDPAEQEASFMKLYDSLMKFVITSIDKFLMETAHDSVVSTPHEQWFQKSYGKQLIQACNLLQKPTSMKNYRQGWECFQQFHRQLMAETHKVRILELSQVSPYLHNMKNTPIGLPGQNEKEESCFIDSFGANVIVLPTKTKPKKLDLKGSDGKKYSYLFKGLEDLHLDERIMQLLTTTNGLLSENGATALRGMRARTYAVIPLSDHSGMIQWVNDATPFFALFKKWQKRESTAHMLLNNDKPNEVYMQSLMQRPTEQFTAKVASILKSAGLRVTANRRYWPKEVLKKVYLELVKETPGDLLQKEIYYSSATATEWFKKSTSFARSLAVTSMIGYIIGLGDRHLDNMLVDFRSGEVIHIDYNVCFEKGKRLRVPELVPYRLTQNLYGALGITGVDGQFKAAAEETLRVLRKHKEVLITLLDAFVYDPLVDWESEAMEAGHRQMMELQANLSLVATRVINKQAEQDKERRIILGSLSGLRHNLHQWQESMLMEAETLNAEDASDEEEQGLEHDAILSSATMAGEDATFMGRLPLYLLREVKSHLTNVYSLVRDSRSPAEGIAPLLESIIIIETDADNELRPAQSSAKTALDAITLISTELKKFDKQLIEKTNYESEWTYSQLLEFINTVSKSVQDYFTALRTLEEFGPDSVKNSTSSNALQEDEESGHAAEDDKTTHQQASQGPYVIKAASSNHVTKIMKRIRSKLEGVDFGVQHKMNVSEQVARSIEQATSVDNLCMMYEGWTSWV